MGNDFYLGRDFLPEEGQLGKEHVVILTHKLWLKLGSNPNIIGTPMRMDGEPYTVVGVLAPGLSDRGQGQLTVPAGLQARTNQSRLSLATGYGQAEARRNHQAGAGRYGCGDDTHSDGLSEEQQGLGLLRRTAEKRLPPQRKKADTLASARCSGFCPADRVRQRRQSLARQEHDPSERRSRSAAPWERLPRRSLCSC